MANRPKELKKAKKVVKEADGRLLDHRPHDQHGPPIQILSEAFAKFAELVRTCTPTAEDCRAASKMVDLVSQVKHISQTLPGSIFLLTGV